ncbi:transcription factor bHLH93-like isoform X2 [Salvia hispanica]|uniref:transcription factor bHLH93-like isoform X2 n=1 Tax=Salvia hispanica TaxID=49212 RepID=UPI002009645F|nr:transcription factor bHLH93-like isoform X2 [Salvia hispanica]
MEYYTNDQHGLLEELLCLESLDHCTNQQSYINIPTTDDCFQNLSSYAPFGAELSPPDFTVDSSTFNLLPQTLPYDFTNALQNADTVPIFNIGQFCPPAAAEIKTKLNGQPSKNLMAERRRRKRLNDRLSMLRSIVPKISKMDRTSILGDAIDYMRELLERINKLREETHLGENQLSVMSIFKDAKPANDCSPKFEVERGNLDTRIGIGCETKPGLLLSMVTTLEALGLEIHHCAISCYNDFALQASCSETIANLDPEEIKHSLLRNAGYGGECV